jgi:crotonobetainyl-CoA:carnitine CoA-transferase CaiB-like acyl-CoA transferase
MHSLRGIRILTLAVNLPGPLAVARLRQLGADMTKIEPLGGDPLAYAKPDWYRELHDGIEVSRCDLKTPDGRAVLESRLASADLLITASRPAALARLGLAWPELHINYPRLSHVAIVGHESPDEETPGHDLTYQAECGLVAPPSLPRACIADWAGAQEVVISALSLLFDRGEGRFAQVSLAGAARKFAAPISRGLTVPDGILGGGFPGYNLYRAREGWIAVAALEPHFWQRLADELRITSPTREELQTVFLERSPQDWESWARERDLPIVRVR